MAWVPESRGAMRTVIGAEPAPDSFLRAAETLWVNPQRSVVETQFLVFTAGVKGGFGLMVGVETPSKPAAKARGSFSNDPS